MPTFSQASDFDGSRNAFPCWPHGDDAEFARCSEASPERRVVDGAVVAAEMPAEQVKVASFRIAFDGGDGPHLTYGEAGIYDGGIDGRYAYKPTLS